MISFISFDRFYYPHSEKSDLASKLTQVISNNFATAGIPFSTTTPTSTTTKSATTTSTTTFVRVLPPESPTNYTDNKDGTITDNYTNLLWVKCTQGMTGTDCKNGSPSLREWSKARVECEGLKLANKTGWRLPTLKELQSIVDSASSEPAINKTFFPKTSNDPYWTDTSPAQYLGSKFTVIFSNGSVYFKDAGNFGATRCVKSN